MNAQKLMKLEIVTVPPELPVEAAHQLMLKLGVRHLPVVADQKLAGIVSDRDILLVSGKSPRGAFVYPALTVGEVMTLAPITASPDASVAELARVMVENKIDALPVLTSQNVLVGLVTSTDLMLLLTELPEQAQPALSFQIRRAADLTARA
jgi:acetoin utilization protein AcuB